MGALGVRQGSWLIPTGELGFLSPITIESADSYGLSDRTDCTRAQLAAQFTFALEHISVVSSLQRQSSKETCA